MVGSLANAFNSDVVLLSIAGSEFVTVYDVEYGKDPPRNRISSRAGKLDTYGPILEDVWCSAVVDKTIFDLIDTASTPNSRRAYPSQAIIVTGQALSGVSNDLTISFSAEIPTLKFLAPGGGVATAIRFHIISLNT